MAPTPEQTISSFSSNLTHDGTRTSSAPPAPIPGPSAPEHSDPAQRIAALEASLAEHKQFISSLQGELKRVKRLLKSEKGAHDQLKFKSLMNQASMNAFLLNVEFGLENQKSAMGLVRTRTEWLEQEIESKDAKIIELKERLEEEEMPGVARMG